MVLPTYVTNDGDGPGMATSSSPPPPPSAQQQQQQQHRQTPSRISFLRRLSSNDRRSRSSSTTTTTTAAAVATAATPMTMTRTSPSSSLASSRYAASSSSNTPPSSVMETMSRSTSIATASTESTSSCSSLHSADSESISSISSSSDHGSSVDSSASADSSDVVIRVETAPTANKTKKKKNLLPPPITRTKNRRKRKYVWTGSSNSNKTKTAVDAAADAGAQPSTCEYHRGIVQSVSARILLCILWCTVSLIVTVNVYNNSWLASSLSQRSIRQQQEQDRPPMTDTGRNTRTGYYHNVFTSTSTSENSIINHIIMSAGQHGSSNKDTNDNGKIAATSAAARRIETVLGRGSNGKSGSVETGRDDRSSPVEDNMASAATAAEAAVGVTSTITTYPATSDSNAGANANSTTRASPEYAYAFVITGCSKTKPSYRYYLYDVMIAAYMLRQDQTQADIVLFVQMAADTAKPPHNERVLPDEELRWLDQLGVKIQYIPSVPHDTFYSSIFNKFRVLSLTQYSKVLFMDADVMPLGNLDYMFELSANGTLMENFIIPEHNAPSNAGFFLMTPYPGALDDIDMIIASKEEYYNNNQAKNGKAWDTQKGWGHEIQYPDYWQSVRSFRLFDHIHARWTSRKWQFTSASADQGLLFYYTKYFRQSVSIVWANTVENWSRPRSSEAAPTAARNSRTSSSTSRKTATGDYEQEHHVVDVALQETLHNPFQYVRSPMYRGMVENPFCRHLSPAGCYAPISDFVHFWAEHKPWLMGPPDGFLSILGRVMGPHPTTTQEVDRIEEARDELSRIQPFLKTPRHLWYYMLARLDKELAMDLHLDEWAPHRLTKNYHHASKNNHDGTENPDAAQYEPPLGLSNQVFKPVRGESSYRLSMTMTEAATVDK